MRVASWTIVMMFVVVLGGCGADDDPASDDASSGAETTTVDLVACLEEGGFKKGDLPVAATEVEGAENVGEFLIPDTDSDYLIVYETDSSTDAESMALDYFGTGVYGAIAVGTRFYAYTTDAPPVQPTIESCLSS